MVSALWSQILPSAWRRAASPRQCIAVQHLVAPQRDLVAVQRVLNALGARLNVVFDLHHGRGDVVLLDGDLVSRLSLQQIDAFAEDRPLVTWPGALDAGSVLDADQTDFHPALHQNWLQADLARQLGDLPQLQSPGGCDGVGARRGPVVAALPRPGAGVQAMAIEIREHTDGWTVERKEGAAWQSLMQQLLQGRQDPNTAPLTLGYGEDARLFVDFQQRQVRCETLALQHLRVSRERPWRMSGDTSAATPPPGCTARDLDDLLWDLGIASGAMPLWRGAGDAAKQHLSCPNREPIARRTRTPSHLEAARRLHAAPATLAELRRCLGVAEADLRRFLQAALVLGLLRWVHKS